MTHGSHSHIYLHTHRLPSRKSKCQTVLIYVCEDGCLCRDMVWPGWGDLILDNTADEYTTDRFTVDENVMGTVDPA